MPADDAVVVEHVVARARDPGARDVVVVKELLRRDPRDVAAAVRLAQLYVDAGRRDSDPRPLGRAQAVLSSWWKEADPPVPVLLLRATILQFRHEFAPARADLERALEREPRNAQAWLTLATLQQVTGDLDAARASCARLTQLVPALIHDACAWSVEGATGQGTFGGARPHITVGPLCVDDVIHGCAG